MLQETTQAAAATGGNAASALTQMGVDHLLTEMMNDPGSFAVSWAVLITLTLMSAMSIYWIVINFFKNMSLRRGADRVVSTFWETPNAQDAIRFMEEQPQPGPRSRSPDLGPGREVVPRLRGRGHPALQLLGQRVTG